MSESRSNVNRRTFMAAGTAVIAAPILKNMAGMVPEAKAAETKYDFVERKRCDLVVLGGGGSGLTAAVRAAQLTGKKVVVLEKAAFAGGGAQSARTFRTFGSKWQAKRNLPDTTVAYAREMMDRVSWRLDPELVTNCLLGTGQFFDWLCELGGDIEDKFTPGRYHLAGIESDPIGPQMEGQGPGAGFGALAMNIMKEKCETYGVEVLTKHPVVDVEVKNGKIVAAITKSDKGHVRVACNACILATGSWISNEEIVKKYAPKYFAAMNSMEIGAGQGGEAPVGMPDGGGAGRAVSVIGHTSPYYTGDGFALAEKVGAFVDYDSLCIRYMGPSSMTQSKVFSSMAVSPYVMTVNLEGRRFCAEPVIHMGLFEGGYIQCRQPRGRTYDIFDRNALEATLAYQKCLQEGRCADLRTSQIQGPPVSLPDTMEEIQSDIDKSLTGGGGAMLTADTLEELADKMGVHKKNFLETAAKYNESCKTGIDLGCYKQKEYLVSISKPPYYAFREGVGTDGAFGGVLVNPEMQAYSSDRSSLVKGLYVIGDFASGRHINLGGVKRQVLNDLAWAFSSGFLAGTNVADYLKNLG